VVQDDLEDLNPVLLFNFSRLFIIEIGRLGLRSQLVNATQSLKRSAGVS
jgi:hypothetical protein